MKTVAYLLGALLIVVAVIYFAMPAELVAELHAGTRGGPGASAHETRHRRRRGRRRPLRHRLVHGAARVALRQRLFVEVERHRLKSELSKSSVSMRRARRFPSPSRRWAFFVEDLSQPSPGHARYRSAWSTLRRKRGRGRECAEPLIQRGTDRAHHAQPARLLVDLAAGLDPVLEAAEVVDLVVAEILQQLAGERRASAGGAMQDHRPVLGKILVVARRLRIGLELQRAARDVNARPRPCRSPRPRCRRARRPAARPWRPSPAPPCRRFSAPRRWRLPSVV